MQKGTWHMNQGPTFPLWQEHVLTHFLATFLTSAPLFSAGIID
jgi:hypothetical protein